MVSHTRMLNRQGKYSSFIRPTAATGPARKPMVYWEIVPIGERRVNLVAKCNNRYPDVLLWF